MTVLDAWFNRPITDDLFSYEGIGVLPGTSVLNFDTAITNTYLGDNKLVPPGMRTAQYDPPSQPLAPVPGRVNYWLIALCGVLAAVAAGLFYRLARSRSA